MRDRQQVELLIPPPGCLLWVTSRQHFVLPGLVAKNLYQLPAEDARALLVRIAPRLQKESIDKVAELAGLCGYLPQALRAVASALAVHVDISPHEYALRLSDARERLTLTDTGASLQVSYDLLAQEQQKSFCALAVFPGSFDPGGAAAIWGIPEDAAKTARQPAALQLGRVQRSEQAPPAARSNSRFRRDSRLTGDAAPYRPAASCRAVQGRVGDRRRVISEGRRVADERTGPVRLGKGEH